MKQKENGWWKKDFRSQFPGLMYTIISEGEDDGEICSGEEYVEYFISQVEQDARKDERERVLGEVMFVVEERRNYAKELNDASESFATKGAIAICSEIIPRLKALKGLSGNNK